MTNFDQMKEVYISQGNSGYSQPHAVLQAVTTCTHNFSSTWDPKAMLG